jgi:hypothetical protein
MTKDIKDLTPVRVQDEKISDTQGKERKGPDCDYDKQNISVVICDTDTL